MKEGGGEAGGDEGEGEVYLCWFFHPCLTRVCTATHTQTLLFHAAWNLSSIDTNITRMYIQTSLRMHTNTHIRFVNHGTLSSQFSTSEFLIGFAAFQ